MVSDAPSNADWLDAWMRVRGVSLWGAADLAGLATPVDDDDHDYPRAIAWAYPMPPHVMGTIQNGPNRAYAEAYVQANTSIDRTAVTLCEAIRACGFRASPLAASERTDPRSLRGDFPHKTAATRAGLGWIGRNCQLVTLEVGPWVRLGTVFTDMPLSCGPESVESECGGCGECVDVCPANALTGEDWQPGIERAAILDTWECDRWKKESYSQFNGGHNCGICAAVCQFGIATLG